MKRKLQFDWMLIVIAVLLMATLTAFLTGLFVYPFGLFILLILFVARLLYHQSKK